MVLIMQADNPPFDYVSLEGSKEYASLINKEGTSEGAT